MEEILTPSHVAALLKIHVQTVYRLAEQGKIPGNKIGRSWRFIRTDILSLISNHDAKAPTKPKSAGRKTHNKVPSNENDEG